MKKLIRVTTCCILALGIAVIIMVTAPTAIKRDIVRETAKHVVPFRLLVRNNDRYASASHIVHNGKVFILTNRHVCDLNSRVYNKDIPGLEIPASAGDNIQFGDYVGKVIKVDIIHDLCLVTSNRTDGIKLAENALKPLDELILIGYPRGIGMTVRKGRVIESGSFRAPWLDGRTVRNVQISAMAYPGNSGSPVVNLQGELIGVLFAGSYPSEPFMVPHYYVKAFLDRYAK